MLGCKFIALYLFFQLFENINLNISFCVGKFEILSLHHKRKNFNLFFQKNIKQSTRAEVFKITHRKQILKISFFKKAF